jgi:outer membrane protein
MLAAGPTFAQAPSPAQPAPGPAAPAAPAAAQPAALRPFPEGAKYAVVNIQRIAAESAEGKAATTKVQALNQQKVNELNEKNKQLQAAQQKLESGASVLSDAARGQLEKEIVRMQTDIQRFTEDAQEEVQALQNDLMGEFQRKLAPVIQQVATEKRLHLLFSAADSGIVWAEPGLDITTEVIKKFDTPGGTASVAPAPKPAAPAPPVPAPAPRTNPAPR